MILFSRERQLERYWTWRTTQASYPNEWREAASHMQHMFYMTSDELAQLNQDLLALLLPRYRERLTDPLETTSRGGTRGAARLLLSDAASTRRRRPRSQGGPMSFGMTHAMVECRVADLHQHAADGRKKSVPADETSPGHGRPLSFGLRNRIGLTLVELGLHL